MKFINYDKHKHTQYFSKILIYEIIFYQLSNYSNII